MATVRPEGLLKNSNDTIGNRTRDLPTCSAVPQPTAPPRAPNTWSAEYNYMFIFLQFFCPFPCFCIFVMFEWSNSLKPWFALLWTQNVTHLYCLGLSAISGYRLEVTENCPLLGYYAVSSGNFLPTFRDNLSVPSSGFNNKKICIHSNEIHNVAALIVYWCSGVSSTCFGP